MYSSIWHVAQSTKYLADNLEAAKGSELDGAPENRYLLLLLLLLLDFSLIFRRFSSTFDPRRFFLDFGPRGPFSAPGAIRNEPRMKN